MYKVQPLYYVYLQMFQSLSKLWSITNLLCYTIFSTSKDGCFEWFTLCVDGISKIMVHYAGTHSRHAYYALTPSTIPYTLSGSSTMYLIICTTTHLQMLVNMGSNIPNQSQLLENVYSTFQNILKYFTRILRFRTNVF